MTGLSDIISNWLEGVEFDLVKNYDKLGLRASGLWARSLEQFQDLEGLKYKIGIKGQRYTGALEQGRKPTATTTPGNPTLREVIRKWIDDKGIVPRGGINKNSLAFLISRKIHERGIKVPNKFNKGGLVSNVVTKQRINELNKALSQQIINDYRSEIIKEFR